MLIMFFIMKGSASLKKKFAWIIPITIIVILVSYLFLTTMGALRLAVTKEGYPINAFTLRLSDKTFQGSIEDNQTMYTIQNPPHENPTNSDLVNWVVVKKGVIYFGSYYGW